MKILVTGGAGAVGSNLIKKLVKKNYDVTSWDNYYTGKEENHIDGAKYFNFDTKDTTTKSLKFDLVYHLGEYSKVHPSFEIPKKLFELNIIGSFNLIQSCTENKIPIVYAGSSTRLTPPGEFGSPYAFYKSTISKLISCYSKWYNLKYNICYFYNVYGPKTDTWNNEFQSVINVFRDQKKENKPLTITGDGKQKRDFTHVNDIVNGLILAGSNICNEEFQLGTGKSYSILDIAKAFDHKYVFIKERKGERMVGSADISKTMKILNYKPSYDIINFIKENYK